MYNELALRPNVQPTSQVMGLIAPGHCWHFDAWLYAVGGVGHDAWFRIETRAGGRDLLTASLYCWDGERLTYMPEHRLAQAIAEGRATPATLQDKALWPRFAELNDVHWQRIVPMAERVPAGFRSKSVAFHYVRAPSIAPFEDGVANFHQYGVN